MAEKNERLVKIYEEQQRVRAREKKPSSQVAPLFGQNPFEPSSRISRVPSDPSLAEPLPSGRFIDSTMPSDLNAARMSQVQEYLKDPKKYMQDNATQIVNEQSLLDKGKSMMSKIFDFQDEADAQIFGVSIAPVESAFDGFMRTYTGFYDLLGIGFGGLISAAPGGVQTLSYDQLSGGKGVGEVLSGKMEPGSAPSPGQIAVTSIGIEAARIRNGNARLSDVLLLNPATGPFLLAALAADTSPVQQEGFDLMNKEQREKAFSEGWEKWGSGTTDFGLAFADPLIGAGVVGKVMRLGMLGQVGPARIGAKFGVHSDEALREIGRVVDGDEQFLIRQTDEFIAQGATKSDVIRDIQNGQLPEGTITGLRSYTTADPVPELTNNLGRFLYQVTLKDAETGNKVMPLGEVMTQPEIRALSNKAEVAQLLYDSDSPVIASLVLGDIMGTPGARARLQKLRPAMADMTYRLVAEQKMAMRLTEPQKIAESKRALESMISNLHGMQTMMADEIAKAVDPKTTAALTSRLQNYSSSIDEARELLKAVDSGVPIDRANPQSAFFDIDYLDEITRDLHSQSDVVTRALNLELQDTAAQARMMFPTVSNPYSNMVAASRRRRAKAAYQYAEEGTNILPRKVVTGVDMGRVSTQWQFWSSSKFEGVNRFQRNARVWRWMGTETPVGYIGLKGTSAVGQDREMQAVLNLDLYSQNPIEAKILKRDDTGAVLYDEDGVTPLTETVTVGGSARRQEIMSMYTKMLTDKDIDPLFAVMTIEEEVMKDFAKMYGFTDSQVKNFLLRANKGRDAVVDLVRQRGFFIDPVDGSRHYAPYLDSQLANGTYMHNFQELEKVLRRESIRDGAKQFREWTDNVFGLVGGVYDQYESLWRPATLLRLSYTQRNVVEGMFRAAAFSASAAPLLWPVRATAHGIRNKYVGRSVGKKSKRAVEAVSDSEYAALRRQMDEAAIERLRYEQAFEAPPPGSTDPDDGLVLYIATGKGGLQSSYEVIDPSAWRAGRDRAEVAYAEAEERVKANVGKFEQALEGTEVGVWRKQQIAGLTEQIEGNKRRLDQIREFLGQFDADGNLITPDDVIFKQISDIQKIIETDISRLERITYDPIGAVSEYGAAAGRQKRIGSGTSIAPDGSYYNNAFEGPYEQIARANLSADNTVKQAMSLHADIMGSLFKRVALRTNTAIQWDGVKPEAWITGMKAVIETNSSSALVREMTINNFDLEATYRWLLTDEGDRWWRATAPLQGVEGQQLNSLNTVAEAFYGETTARGRVAGSERTRRVAGSEDQLRMQKGKAGSRQGRTGTVTATASDAKLTTLSDKESTMAYLRDIAERVQDQMQRQPGFIDLLRARSMDKRGIDVDDPMQFVGRSGSLLTDDAIKRVIDSLPPNVRDNLGYVQGSEMIEMGVNSVQRVYANTMNRLFRVLGTIPEDAVVRGPFYASRFRAARDDMIEMYLVRTGQGNRIRRGKPVVDKAGKQQPGALDHDSFKIEAGEMQRIYYQAHRKALKDTREWMYTIERRTNLGKYGEWIWPFISATQNSVTTAGKLLYKEPWLAPFIADLWRAPNRAGFEDEEGNLQLPMPAEWVRNLIKDNPSIPFFGGLGAPGDMLTIPKGGLNLWLPESGFGVAPRPGPWVQVAASELMKVGMFGQETPKLLATSLGQKNADEFWKAWKDYIFGEEQGPSSNVGSWDLLVPAYGQKIINSKNTLSSQYGYTFHLQWATQQARFQAGDRDKPPTEDEIHEITTNAMLFQALGNLGVPTPLTPYPILTRPQINSAAQSVIDQYKLYQEADPLNATKNFFNDYGDMLTMTAQTKVTKNVGGIDATAQAVTDAQTFSTLIAKVSNDITNKNVLGILVNNRSPNANYEDATQADYANDAYSWQKAVKIPGTSQSWREVQSPEESLADRQATTGWAIYRQAMDQLDAMLASAGLPNYEVKAAYEYKMAKEQLVKNMSNNPDLEGWYVDYSQRSGSNTIDAVRVMQAAVQDPTFVKEIGGHDPILLSNMSEYLRYREMVINLVKESGKGIDQPENQVVKDAWATIRQQLKAHPRWAEIADRYLSGDDNPQFPGNIGMTQYYGDIVNGESVGN